MLIRAAIALLAASIAVRAETFPIAVGASGLTFNPTSVAAKAGDTITFSFQGTHTATQSTFASPCTALQGGADSGTKSAGGATFNYTVTDTKPVWFFCAIPSHCKSGMVFAVNPTSDQTFDAFQAAAKGGSSSGGSSSASASATQNDSSGYGYGSSNGKGGAMGRAAIGLEAVAGAVIVGALAAI